MITQIWPFKISAPVNEVINVQFCFLQWAQMTTKLGSCRKHVHDNQRCWPTPISASASSCSYKVYIIIMAEIKTLLRPCGFRRRWGLLLSRCDQTASPRSHSSVSVLISDLKKKKIRKDETTFDFENGICYPVITGKQALLSHDNVMIILWSRDKRMKKDSSHHGCFQLPYKH